MLLYDAAPARPTFAPDFKGAVAGDDERRNAAAGLWDATRDLGLYRDNANAEDTATAEAYARRNKAIFDATGVQLTNPRSDFSSGDLRAAAQLQDAGGDPWVVMQRREAKWADDVKRLARERPEFAGVIQADRPIREDAFAIARGAETGLDQASQRAEAAGVGALSKLGAALGGGTAAMMRDPLQVGTLTLGGGISAPAKSVVWAFVQRMFTEAAINGGVEAGVQLAAEDWKKQAGTEHGLVPGLKQVGLAALFGAGFGGLLEGGTQVFKLLGRDVPTDALNRAAAGEPAPGDIGTLATALGVELDPHQARAVELAADQSNLDRAAFGEPPAGVTAAEADSLAADALRAIETPIGGSPVRDLADRHETIERIVGRDMPVGAAPKKPVSLMQFLAARSVGGLVDDNGALAAMGLSKKFVPGSGPLLRKNGKSLDYAREAAAEAGYFDDIYGHPDLATQRSTVDDLLRKLQAEAGGEPAYSPRNDNGRIYDWQDYEARVRSQNAYRRLVQDIDGAIDDLGIEHSIDDKIIANAARYVDDTTDPAAALERALDEDYRSFADALSQRGEKAIDESDIPFFENTGASPDTGRPADGAGGDGGPAGRGAAAPDGGQLSRARGDQGAAAAESLKPAGDLPEPGTTEAADIAALTLTEATTAGEQTLLGGVKPVTTKEKLQSQAAKPLKGGDAPPPEGGLFDLESRKQLDIWDAMPAAKNADGTVLHATHETMIADAERSEFYAGIIASCRE